MWQMFLIEAGNNLPVYINNGKARLVKHIFKNIFLPLPKENCRRWVSLCLGVRASGRLERGRRGRPPPGGNICLRVSTRACFLSIHRKEVLFPGRGDTGPQWRLPGWLWGAGDPGILAERGQLVGLPARWGGQGLPWHLRFPRPRPGGGAVPPTGGACAAFGNTKRESRVRSASHGPLAHGAWEAQF